MFEAVKNAAEGACSLLKGEVSPEEQARRMEICLKCPETKDTPNGKRCRFCGCPLRSVVRFKCRDEKTPRW